MDSISHNAEKATGTRRSASPGILKDSLAWLIRLRWFAVIGVLCFTHVVRLSGLLTFPLIPVYAVLGSAALSNLLYAGRLARPRENLVRLAFVQIVADQAQLALAVYFSGGFDSPFIYFFLFHVVICGIVLPGRYTAVCAGTGVLFPGLLIALRRASVLPGFSIFPHHARIFPEGSVVTAYSLAFVSTIFLTAFFVNSLTSQIRYRNRQMRQLYRLSERLRASLRVSDVIAVLERELRRFTGAHTSAYLPLDRKQRSLVFAVDGRRLSIPLIIRNSLSEALLRGLPFVIDRRFVQSEYEVRVLELLCAQRCLILPVQAASALSCRRHFQCHDDLCAAYEDGSRPCWQVAGTHCKGTLFGNREDKVAVCAACDLFTPMGVYALNLPSRELPWPEDEEAVTEACMQLLNAASLALANGLLQEKAEQLSKTDGLTGIGNRRAFEEKFRAEVLRSRRYGRSFSLLMIDVDHFKQYNDRHGHQQGDFVLRKIAGLIRDNVQPVDVIARFGGEEFAVLLLETGEKDRAVAVADRLRLLVQQYRFPYEETQPGGDVTVSIGVSCYPEDGDSGEGLMRSADQALYRAKQAGRNRVAVAGPLGRYGVTHLSS